MPPIKPEAEPPIGTSLCLNSAPPPTVYQSPQEGPATYSPAAETIGTLKFPKYRATRRPRGKAIPKGPAMLPIVEQLNSRGLVIWRQVGIDQGSGYIAVT